MFSVYIFGEVGTSKNADYLRNDVMQQFIIAVDGRCDQEESNKINMYTC